MTGASVAPSQITVAPPPPPPPLLALPSSSSPAPLTSGLEIRFRSAVLTSCPCAVEGGD